MNPARDAYYMARAIRVAHRARYSSHPNPYVGCVLVKGDTIIAEGHTEPVGQPHAEASALRKAGDDARGATAYVTLEPCSFYGRTPACSGALIEAGVSRVVVAMLDPDERNAGRGIQMLEDAGIAVTVGVLEASARDLLGGHIKRLTQGRPFVRLKLGMTLDGKTALANGESKWITSPQARSDVQRYRAMSAAIVTGVQTVIDDDPSMNVRPSDWPNDAAPLAATVTRPVYILDSNWRIPANAKLLQASSTVVVGAAQPDRELPVETLVLDSDGDRVDLGALLDTLAAREHSEVLFECGATLAGALIEARLVDELIIYTAPKIIGHSGRALLNMTEVARMPDLSDLTITDVRQIGPDIRIIAHPIDALV